MTANQLKYQDLQETIRSNMAKEALTSEANALTSRNLDLTDRKLDLEELKIHRDAIAKNRQEVKYWIDVAGIGPQARSDFAKVFSSIMG